MTTANDTNAEDGVVPDLRSILKVGDEVWVRGHVVEVSPWDMGAPAKVEVEGDSAADFEGDGNTATGWINYWDIKLKEQVR